MHFSWQIMQKSFFEEAALSTQVILDNFSLKILLSVPIIVLQYVTQLLWRAGSLALRS